jgi:hypothetical protein
VILYITLPKVFYSKYGLYFSHPLDLISLLCLRHLCRCPLTITFLPFGILSSSVIKWPPFSNLYSIGIDMLVSMEPSILLFQILTYENSVVHLNILVYMFTIFLSFETSSYSVVKSLSFGNFHFLGLVVLVSLESCIFSFL